MAVATARSNWKDAAGTPAEPFKNRNMYDYGPFSTRVVCPTGQYLFSERDEAPARPYKLRGRKMTPVDFQVVSMYSDLTRRDIGYLQSIARIYDVTQMREIIQCRLNHMGKKNRCLDVTRHEDYNVYGGYLEKKYGDRMPELMPLIHSQARRPKVWPHVTEYPVIRNQPRFRDASIKDNRQASTSRPKAVAEEDSSQKDSSAAVRGSEVSGTKPYRKTSIKKGKAADKPGKVEQKPVAEKGGSTVVRKSEPGGGSGAVKKVDGKGVLRKSEPFGGSGAEKRVDGKGVLRKSEPGGGSAAEKRVDGKGVVRKSEPGGGSGAEKRVDGKGVVRKSEPGDGSGAEKGVDGKGVVLKTEPGGASGASGEPPKRSSKPIPAQRNKDTAKKLSHGKSGEIVSHSKEGGGEEPEIDSVDMFLHPKESEGTSSFEPQTVEADDKIKAGKAGVSKRAVTPKKAVPAKKAVSGDGVDAESKYAGEKFEEPSVSDDVTPEIAKSMSLEDVEGVFSPEYDEITGRSRGQEEVKGDAVYQEDEDVEDRPTENARKDEPAEEMDEGTVARLEKSDPMAPLWLFEDDDEKVQVFPTQASSFVELEALEMSSADDELSKDRSSAREDTTSKEYDSSRGVSEQEHTDTSETQDLTTSGDDEDEYEFFEEKPSCIF